MIPKRPGRRIAIRNASPNQVFDLLLHMHRRSLEGKYMPVLIWGEAGVGKSAVVKQAAKEINRRPGPYQNNFYLVDLRLGQMEVGDLIGYPREEHVFPCYICLEEGRGKEGKSSRLKEESLYTRRDLLRHIRSEHNSNAGVDELKRAIAVARSKYPQVCDFRMMHTKPDWFPPSDTGGILFLDEVNRADPPVLQAVFQLILDRRLHTHVLPKGWIIVGAANPPKEGYKVTPITDQAFLGRWMHVAFDPSVELWKKYAESHDVNPDVLSFISKKGEALGCAEEPANLSDYNVELRASPRSWEKLGEVWGNDLPAHLYVTVAKGFLPADGVKEWLDFYKTKRGPITAEELSAGGYNQDLRALVRRWEAERNQSIITDSVHNVVNGMLKNTHWHPRRFSARVVPDRHSEEDGTPALKACVDFLTDLESRETVESALRNASGGQLSPLIRPILTPYLKRIVAYLAEHQDPAVKQTLLELCEATAKENPSRFYRGYGRYYAPRWRR